MKERKLLDAIGMADEKYVSEAAPGDKKRLRHPFYIAIAACLCFILTVSLGVIIWQNSGIRKYKDSEYYGVIKVLGEYYDYLDSRPSSSGDSTNSGEDSTKSEEYVEVTDNQETGVIEADYIKRSDRYVYYTYTKMNGIRDCAYVKVYSIEGEYSQRKAFFEIETELSYIYNSQLYLSADCQTLTVIMEGYQKDSHMRMCVYAYDVSDVFNITLKGKWMSNSHYLQSRLVGDELILVTRWNAKRNADFDDLTQYVPYYDAGDGVQFVPADKIYHPQSVRNSAYYMFTKLDINSLSVIDVAATLSYTEEMYFTEDTIYLQCVQKDKTLISGLRYRGESEMKLLGTAEVKGRILNQYSMDEHEGILRLVTNDGLYCISLEDWTIKASVLGFVPEGEDVKSVRFDGDYAYVCTAIVKIDIALDPVFFFDLSDLSNITYKQTEEIPGYSHSLVNFGGGYLLGIGYDEESRGKIEIYKESENGVVAVCQYIANGWITDNYKAFYIDRENQCIGFSADNRHYVVLEFDGKALNVKDEIAFAVNNYGRVRAFYDDGYLYLFESGQFKVYDLESGRERDPVYGYLLPKDTNLEFWIDQGANDIDYSQYAEYGHRTYLGTGYTLEGNELPKHYVLYTISPKSVLHRDRIHQIQITDPAVKLYGLSLDSSKEEIVSTMETEGFNVGEIESEQTIVAIKTMFDKRYSIYFTEKEIRMTVETLP